MTDTTIGIDISKDHLDACRWPADETCRVSNDAAGHRNLLRWIGADLALHKAAIPCAKLNPARVRRFAEAIGTRAKTDRVDARLIARMAAMVEPAPQAPKPAGHAPLHELQLARTSLVRARTAARNRARHLTLPLLRRQHADRLRCIRRDLAAIDAAIAALIAADPEIARKAAILCSIPGISKVSAAAILADLPEIGTLEPAAVASLAGVAPITRESGEWKGQARVGGGRRDLRRALYMPALAAARFNPNLEAVYERLRARGKPGKLALTAVMRKLILLANLLVHENRLWEPR